MIQRGGLSFHLSARFKTTACGASFILAVLASAESDFVKITTFSRKENLAAVSNNHLRLYLLTCVLNDRGFLRKNNRRPGYSVHH